MRNLANILIVFTSVALFSNCSPNVKNNPPATESYPAATKQALREILKSDWDTLDKKLTDSKKSWIYEEFSPPFPNSWPPKNNQVYSYYVTAGYQEFQMHGPSLSFSAPWAKVYIAKGVKPKKEIISTLIGPAVSGLNGHPLGPLQAKRLIDIYEYENTYIPLFLNWTQMPNNEEEIKAVRAFYCQWHLDHRLLSLTYIKENHTKFYEWLSCESVKLENGVVMP